MDSGWTSGSPPLFGCRPELVPLPSSLKGVRNITTSVGNPAAIKKSRAVMGFEGGGRDESSPLILRSSAVVIQWSPCKQAVYGGCPVWALSPLHVTGIMPEIRKMRTCICVNYEGRAYKLVWINEDSKGIYLGWYGAVAGMHVSYHSDGSKHFRQPDSSIPHPPHDGTAIADIDRFVQVGFQAIPLYQDMLSIAGFEYRQEDKKSSNVIILPHSQFAGGTLALDAYILHREKEAEFVDFAFSRQSGLPYDFVALHLFSLFYFPNHKVGLVILSGKNESHATRYII